MYHQAQLLPPKEKLLLLARKLICQVGKKVPSTQHIYRSKIRTLSDINSSGQNNDSDDDEHENLYAGGEKS